MELNNFEWRKLKILLINFGIEALGVRQLASFLKRFPEVNNRVNILFLQHGIGEKQAILVANFIDYNS